MTRLPEGKTRLDLVQFGPWSVMAAKQYYVMTGDEEAPGSPLGATRAQVAFSGAPIFGVALSYWALMSQPCWMTRSWCHPVAGSA